MMPCVLNYVIDYASRYQCDSGYMEVSAKKNLGLTEGLCAY